MTIRDGEIIVRQQDYISTARRLTTELWNAIHQLKDLQAEWIALDYSNTLPDGSGANEGYSRQEVSDVVNTTTNAILELLNQGHGTNLAHLL